jgi:hypothetical protein
MYHADLVQYQCFASCVPLYTRGVHLRYDNLRDAAEGMAILTEHGFLVEYISGYQYAVAKAQDTSQINEFEGQIKLPVIIEANPNDAMWSFTPDDLVEVCNTIQVNVADFGTVRNCFHVETNQASMKVVFRIEFHSVDASTRAVQSLRADSLWGFSTAVSSSHLYNTSLLTSLQKTFKWMTDEPSLWCGERPRGSPHRTMPRVDDKGRIAGYRAANNNDPFAGEYVSTVRFHPADQHNRVRRERILDGSDVRTTIMLRNIPNKMDWVSLFLLSPHLTLLTFIAVAQGHPRRGLLRHLRLHVPPYRLQVRLQRGLCLHQLCRRQWHDRSH